MDLPPLRLVAARLADHALADPVGTTLAALQARLDSSWAGRRVAVAVGSRGIDRHAEIVRAVVAALRARGALPFVIPAMGSHGGGTDAGQVDVLATLGITAESVGAPIVSDIETEEVACSPRGFPVHTAKDARSADGLVIVNRIKPHTDFASDTLGSGLLKMTAVGLGKVAGARALHEAAWRLGYESVLREAALLALQHLPNVLGVALVEDGHHRLAQVEVLAANEFETREPQLLRQAREWMPMLPFAEIDILILDEIGKNVSGVGMDTNVVGRGVDGRPRPDRRTSIRSVIARGLTPETHGNALGVGLADVVRTRLVEAFDPHSTYANVLAALTPAMARLPLHFASDRECLVAALRLGGITERKARVVRARNTLALDRLLVSTSFDDELRERDDLTVQGSEQPWEFDVHGNLDDAALL